jgi:hypothetical protein
MTTDQYLVVGRIIERLIVCLTAGASLTFGWNLFRLGIVTDQSADFAAGKWKATLNRVGPGVFFALFGATVLAISLQSPLQVKSTAENGERGSITYMYSGEADAANAIDVQYQNGAIKASEAYRQLRDLVTKQSVSK